MLSRKSSSKFFHVVSVLLLAFSLGASAGDHGEFAGTYEGTKANGRHHHTQEPWGPIEIQSKGHGTYTITYKGSILGGKDYTYGEAKLDHGKLRFSRPGMKIVAAMDHGKLKGHMEHHGMTEKFAMSRVELRSADAIMKAFHHHGKTARIPSQTEFLRLVLEKGLDAGSMIMKAVHHRDSHHQIFAANTVNNLGYRMLNHGEHKKALTMFKLNVMAFPKDANSYDSLGEAFVKMGERDHAIKALTKSLSMNPADNVRKNSEKLLKELGVDPKEVVALH